MKNRTAAGMTKWGLMCRILVSWRSGWITSQNVLHLSSSSPFHRSSMEGLPPARTEVIFCLWPNLCKILFFLIQRNTIVWGRGKWNITELSRSSFTSPSCIKNPIAVKRRVCHFVTGSVLYREFYSSGGNIGEPKWFFPCLSGFLPFWH